MRPRTKRIQLVRGIGTAESEGESRSRAAGKRQAELLPVRSIFYIAASAPATLAHRDQMYHLFVPGHS